MANVGGVLGRYAAFAPACGLFSRALNYRVLPRTTAYHCVLPRTTAYCRVLPRTAAYYRVLPRVTAPQLPTHATPQAPPKD
eukprot:9647576-Alexandrium_andersonii.AAC.1